MGDRQLQSEFNEHKRAIAGLRRKAVILVVVGILLIAGALCMGRFLKSKGASAIAVLMFVAGTGDLFAAGYVRIGANRRDRKRRQFAKDTITAAALSEAFEDVEYAPDKAVSGSVIRTAGLIKRWDVQYGSDHVRGRYKGRVFAFSDVELMEEVETEDDEGRTKVSYYTCFKGQWIMIETNRDLPGELRLREREKGNRAKSNMETENVAFNAKYQIEAKDAHSAFMMLTPHFMEAIVRADILANGKTYIYFGGRYIHIAIHNNRNLFELSKKNQHADIAAMRACQKNEVKYITDILDIFLLNTKLFG
ncbi:MAG: DUF3137 domain-containing protein [Oscillospiraceae bacterium]|jgi:hypothetical protein|nr:DUF3137 domain-containing protein [Oscillospiraceae bacterium]